MYRSDTETFYRQASTTAQQLHFESRKKKVKFNLKEARFTSHNNTTLCTVVAFPSAVNLEAFLHLLTHIIIAIVVMIAVCRWL